MTSRSEKKLPEIRMGDGSEAAHWYAPPGVFGEYTRCAYEIERKDGKGFRDVNLRDARKLGFYPSVSKIIRQLDSQGLNRWREKQIALSATTLPGVDDIGDEGEWFAAVSRDASEQVKKAAERGKQIHAAIETYFKSGYIDPEYDGYIDSAAQAMNEIIPDWIFDQIETEEACSHPMGYGGRCDLYSRVFKPSVIDIKTKDFRAGEKPQRVYPQQAQQLVAYREALGMPEARCYNVFVSRVDASYQVIEHTEESLQKAWHEFVALLYYWQVSNKVPILARPWEAEAT